jgi:hypothetical protein
LRIIRLSTRSTHHVTQLQSAAGKEENRLGAAAIVARHEGIYKLASDDALHLDNRAQGSVGVVAFRHDFQSLIDRRGQRGDQASGTEDVEQLHGAWRDVEVLGSAECVLARPVIKVGIPGSML